MNKDVFSEDTINKEVINEVEESNDNPEEVLKSEDIEINESTGLGDYISLDSVANLFETFSELGYEYITKNAGKELTSWPFVYKYLGSETIMK